MRLLALALVLVLTAGILTVGVLGKSEPQCVTSVTRDSARQGEVQVPCVEVRDILP